MTLIRRVLIPASPASAAHRCYLEEPSPLPPTALTEHPEARSALPRTEGMVVRCEECGQHWQSDGDWWWPITRRRAARLARAYRRKHNL